MPHDLEKLMTRIRGDPDIQDIVQAIYRFRDGKGCGNVQINFHMGGITTWTDLNSHRPRKKR